MGIPALESLGKGRRMTNMTGAGRLAYDPRDVHVAQRFIVSHTERQTEALVSKRGSYIGGHTVLKLGRPKKSKEGKRRDQQKKIDKQRYEAEFLSYLRRKDSGPEVRSAAQVMQQTHKTKPQSVTSSLLADPAVAAAYSDFVIEMEELEAKSRIKIQKAVPKWSKPGAKTARREQRMEKVKVIRSTRRSRKSDALK
jgi:hypothetical protein